MDNYLGEIRMFGGNFAPNGWALCNGQILSISANAALFSILGTTYGGNGTTSFALPNLQSRVPLHWGQGPGLSTYVIGESTGVENVTLLVNQIPAHTHTVRAVSAVANQALPTNNYIAQETDTNSGDSISGFSNATPDVTLNVASVTPAGGSLPHTNIQPVLAITFIIALVGIFPSRS